MTRRSGAHGVRKKILIAMSMSTQIRTPTMEYFLIPLEVAERSYECFLYKDTVYVIFNSLFLSLTANASYL